MKPVHTFAMILLACAIGCDSRQFRLEELVRQQQASLPMTIDANTTLVDMIAKPLELVHVYQIENVSEELAVTLEPVLEKQIRQKLLQTEASTNSFAEAKIKLTYRYRTKKGKQLIEITILPWEDLTG